MTWMRGFLGVLLMTALTLHGIGVAHADQASPYAGYGDATPGFELPGSVPGANPAPEPTTYPYDAVDPTLANVPAPSVEELQFLPPANELDKMAKEHPADTVEGMKVRYQRYLALKQSSGGTALKWEPWVKKYLQRLTNRRVGPAFEKYLQEEFWKLDDNTWYRNKKIDLPGDRLPAGGSPVVDISNITSAVPQSKWTLVEVKSGTRLNKRDKEQFVEHLKLAGHLGARLVMVFGGNPTNAAVKYMQKAVEDLRTQAGQDSSIALPPGLAIKYVPGKAVPSNEAPSGSVPESDPTLDDAPNSAEDEQANEDIDRVLDMDEPAAQAPSAEPVNAPVNNPAPKQAPVQAPVQVPAPQAPVQVPAPQAPVQVPAPQAPVQVPAPQAPVQVPAPQAPVQVPVPQVPIPVPQIPVPQAPIPVPVPIPVPQAPVAVPAPPAIAVSMDYPTLGGIDFSSLELRYVRDGINGKPAMQYSFQANTTATNVASYGGQRNAKMSTDALYVWLALDPDKFWVNLNPTEPDRIIDSAFGRTEAGKVLLEADLEMKRVSSRLQDTSTDLGKRYAEQLQGSMKCSDGRRHWIEPLPASVHEDGDQLYVVDAPLTVKLGTEDSDISPGETCASQGQDPAATKANLELYQRMIMPALIEQINHAPEFADLRRVYTSRVVAEWYRKRNAAKPGVFAKVINSDNIDKWAHNWSPRGVFDDYVASFSMNPPEATQELTLADGRRITWQIGGVDFAKVELDEIGGTEFDKTYAQQMLPAGPSIAGPTTAPSGQQVWLGNVISDVPLSQVWPSRSEPWTPYTLAPPAPTKPLFYLAITLPAVIWLVSGGILTWRRRRAQVRTGS